ncbi:hypothetical protein P4O66_016067 [Electrophorus voltai]|uniref:Uncharacterized protein n=1 Tax=Electrophorus voltai TaxID=2609070 RepID=A0AAD8YVA3_9TELE|nr:hypothetical protein P4O66_016067 [Electrophorus voltai]
MIALSLTSPLSLKVPVTRHFLVFARLSPGVTGYHQVLPLRYAVEPWCPPQNASCGRQGTDQQKFNQALSCTQANGKPPHQVCLLAHTGTAGRSVLPVHTSPWNKDFPEEAGSRIRLPRVDAHWPTLNRNTRLVASQYAGKRSTVEKARPGSAQTEDNSYGCNTWHDCPWTW